MKLFISKIEHHQKAGQYDDESYLEGPNNYNTNMPSQTAFCILALVGDFVVKDLLNLFPTCNYHEHHT